jgi:ATP-dependent protease Clp ATPase subunit
MAKSSRGNRSAVCSFCGSSGNDVLLLAGHDAYICEACVEKAYEIIDLNRHADKIQNQKKVFYLRVYSDL